MSVPRLAAALAVAALLALAGCASNLQGVPDPIHPPKSLYATFAVHVDANVTVGVPLPHLDRCLAPEAWAAGTATARDAKWHLQAVDRGTVLWVEAAGPGSVQLRIGLEDHPPCQTFRYDPWSVEPDPADGTLEVQGAAGAAGLKVEVLEWVGACGDASSYAGAVGGMGWQVLRAQGDPRTLCA